MKTFFVVEDHTVTNIGLVQLITQKNGLTKQEQKVFKKILERKSKAQIAEELNIISRSVDNYFTHIFEKTGCKNAQEVISKFVE